MKASAKNATPKKLRGTGSSSHAPRPEATSAPGARPSSSANPTSPAANGAVNRATAEARSTASLASCSRIRQSASNDSDGASPTTDSCDTPTTWSAAPAALAASIATGAGAQDDPVGTATIEEHDLLRAGQLVGITLVDDVRLQPVLDRGRPHFPRVLEGLQRDGEVPVVDAAELQHDVCQNLVLLDLSDAHDAQRHDDFAPLGLGPVDAHHQQRVADVIRRV